MKVVFVCEHGAAKSVIAAAWFERLAAEAGLDGRALARGTDLDPRLAESAVSGLLDEGIDVRRWQPREVRDEDLASAWRVVSFGPELGTLVSEHWDEVPPVADGYEPARDAILARLRPLLAHALHT